MGLKKGWWTAEEDRKLISYIQKYGHENWRTLPIRAGLLRCGKSCRLRWVNYLRPGLKHGNYTKEDEDTIIKHQKILGNQWAKIAACLPGRTDNEIKNIWNTYLQKRLPPKKPAPVFKTAAPATSIYGEGEGSTENAALNPDHSYEETSVDNITNLAGTGNTSEAQSHCGISSSTLPADQYAFANTVGAKSASWVPRETLIDENDLIADPFEDGNWNETDVRFSDTATASGFQDVGKDHIEFDDSARWLEELVEELRDHYEGDGEEKERIVV